MSALNNSNNGNNNTIDRDVCRVPLGQPVPEVGKTF